MRFGIPFFPPIARTDSSLGSKRGRFSTSARNRPTTAASRAMKMRRMTITVRAEVKNSNMPDTKVVHAACLRLLAGGCHERGIDHIEHDRAGAAEVVRTPRVVVEQLVLGPT